MGTHRKRPDLHRPKRHLAVKDMTDARDQTATILGKMSRTVLAEVERRSRESCLPDGYPSGGGDGGSRASDETSSTERAALRLVASEFPHDVVLSSCQTFRNALDKCWDAAIEAEDAWDYVLSVSKGKLGRETTLGNCQACLRADVPNVGSDRIRAGYCNACFTAWVRTDHHPTDDDPLRRGSGRQDRHSFELSRREMKAVETG